MKPPMQGPEKISENWSIILILYKTWYPGEHSEGLKGAFAGFMIT